MGREEEAPLASPEFLGPGLLPDRQLFGVPRCAFFPAVHVFNPRRAGISYSPLHVLGQAVTNSCLATAVEFRLEDAPEGDAPDRIHAGVFRLRSERSGDVGVLVE